MPRLKKLHGQIITVAGVRLWGWRGGWKGHAPKEMARRRALGKVQKQARKRNR